VELLQLVSRDPILLVDPSADGPYGVAVQEPFANAEARYVAGEAGSRVLRVPVAGDLRGVGLVEHRIEQRLAGEARREGPSAAPSDQLELLLANRSEEDRRRFIGVDHARSSSGRSGGLRARGSRARARMSRGVERAPGSRTEARPIIAAQRPRAERRKT